ALRGRRPAQSLRTAGVRTEGVSHIRPRPRALLDPVGCTNAGPEFAVLHAGVRSQPRTPARQCVSEEPTGLLAVAEPRLPLADEPTIGNLRALAPVGMISRSPGACGRSNEGAGSPVPTKAPVLGHRPTVRGAATAGVSYPGVSRHAGGGT